MSLPTLNDKIEHIVVLMLENRSFDHLLGTLPGVEGVLDGNGNVKANLGNYLVDSNKNSKFYPVTIGAIFATPENERNGPKKEYGGPAHSFPAATEQLYGYKTIGCGNDERSPYTSQDTLPNNSGFVQSYEDTLKRAMAQNGSDEQPSDASIGEVMQVFTSDQLPAIHTLAQEFCVCDHWFSELPGPTEPNRLFTHSGTSSGLTYNPWKIDRLDVPTIYDRITTAGKDWAFYASDLTDADSFTKLRNLPNSKLSYQDFFNAAAQGNLPFYSFLCPRYTDSPEDTLFPVANSQHAPDDVRYGDQLIAKIYGALKSGPLSQWEKTLFAIVYDEHGGYYDHVVPPEVEPPDNYVSPNDFMWTMARKSMKNAYLTKPEYQFNFRQLGFRVPAVLVSPWIPKGTVAQEEYRHTSLLKLVSELLSTPPLTQRDATALSPSALLSLDAPRTDCPEPENVKAAKVGEDEVQNMAIQADRLAAPPTPKQVEVALRSVSNLPGHPDSDREVVNSFPTRASLASYVEQRTRCAAWARTHSANNARAECYQEQGQWYWRIKEKNGTVLAVSPKSYPTQSDAQHSLERTGFVSQALMRSATRQKN